jgi:hypothetical protein
MTIQLHVFSLAKRWAAMLELQPCGEGLKLGELQTFVLDYGRTGPPPIRFDGLMPQLNN